MPAARQARAGLDITSPLNPQIKNLAALRRRRAREAAGLTLVEGHAEIGLVLSAGARPRAVYVCPELAAAAGPGLAEQVAAAGAQVIRVSREAFGRVAYRESPDGWLAVVPAVRAGLTDLDVGPRPLVLICYGVEKPGNLGAMLRTADAAGVSAVIAADAVTDWGNPNLVRASKGTVFCVPVASAASAEVLDWLAARGIRLAAAAPGAGPLFTDADLSLPVAIAVGSEQRGLPLEWLARADATVRIPMSGRVDSLNVATSAALVVYEAVRQAGLSRAGDPPAGGV